LHWDLEEEQKGDNYSYTVGVKQVKEKEHKGDEYYTNYMMEDKQPIEGKEHYDQYYKYLRSDDCSEQKVEPSESEETCSTQTR